MITFDEFEEAVREEIALLPDYVQEDLNGGVLVDEKAYLHPGALADDLYILGTYSMHWLYGKQIVLYYGSFVRSIGGADMDAWKAQIRKTLRHEYLHHLETKAGLYGKGSLIEEDAESLRRYYRMHGHDS